MVEDPTDKWLEEYLNTKPGEKPKVHVLMYIEEGFSDYSAEEWAEAHGQTCSQEVLTWGELHPDGIPLDELFAAIGFCPKPPNEAA